MSARACWCKWRWNNPVIKQMLDRDFALRHLNTAGGFFFRGSTPPFARSSVRTAPKFHALTDSEASNGFPSWSPDGKRIVYRTDAKQGRGLVIMSLEDHRIRPLTSGPQ
jgi:hypothetical protein